MDMELEEIFQWQTPFCPLLADIGGIEEDGIHSMLEQIELPELQDDLIPGAAAVDTVATKLSSSTITSNTEPVSSPLWPCDLQTSALNNNGILRLPPVQLSLDSVGSPQSSTAPMTGAARESQGSQREASVTPAATKPKRTRATPRASKSTPKAKKPCPDPAVVAEQAKEKENRLPTQAEHIIRERQRRDDMASKYLILESLLPPAPKRERAVVVESAMLFVKDLQQKRNDLLKRRAQLKLMVSSQSPAQQVQSKKTATLHDSSVFATAPGCKKPPENCRTDSPISSSMVATQQELITWPGTTNPASAAVDDPTTGSVQQLHVHVHFSDDEIVIDMVCHQPRDNFQSFLLQAVESFGLDIMRCSIHRVPHGFLQCTITCNKSRGMNASLPSSETRTSETLTGALKNAIARS